MEEEENSARFHQEVLTVGAHERLLQHSLFSRHLYSPRRREGSGNVAGIAPLHAAPVRARFGGCSEPLQYFPAHMPFPEGPMLPMEKPKPAKSPFDPPMSVLPFSSGHQAVPICQERGEGLTGAGRVWWDMVAE